MTLRDRFEKRWPCPEGVHRTESGYEPIKDYSNCAPEDIKSALFQKKHAEIHTARWEAYQAAIEDAVPDERGVLCRLARDQLLSELIEENCTANGGPGLLCVAQLRDMRDDPTAHGWNSMESAPKNRPILFLEGEEIYKAKWNDELQSWSSYCGQPVVFAPEPDAWAEIPVHLQESVYKPKESDSPIPSSTPAPEDDQ